MQKTKCKPTIESLLNRLIDYAGLFPPAELDMATTVRNYAAYLQCDDAWMLGRLIVPVARLDEFEKHAKSLLPRNSAKDDPWSISAITSPAGSEELPNELKRIEAFNETHRESSSGLATIDVVELRGNTAPEIDKALDLMPDELFPYFEIPIVDDPRGRIAVMVGSEAGAKVRTGGIKPEMYPKTAHLARFIATCAAADVPFKATAGMHHPLRHYSEKVGAKEFGFLNVFIGACLAFDSELEDKALIAVLEDESLSAFRIDDDAIGWGEHAIDRDVIADVRDTFAASFGSCSFDEPREDLRAIGLM